MSVLEVFVELKLFDRACRRAEVEASDISLPERLIIGSSLLLIV